VSGRQLTHTWTPCGVPRWTFPQRTAARPCLRHRRPTGFRFRCFHSCPIQGGTIGVSPSARFSRHLPPDTACAPSVRPSCFALFRPHVLVPFCSLYVRRLLSPCSFLPANTLVPSKMQRSMQPQYRSTIKDKRGTIWSWLPWSGNNLQHTCTFEPGFRTRHGRPVLVS